MSMVINTNIQATRTHNVYSKNNDYMNQALTRVATGMKINSAKDGAANWAISEKMRERIRANDQANQNVQNDTALLKTAQGGIGNTIDILKTLKERAINAANDSNINTDRSAIGTEVYQLLEQIDDNAAKVKFNGRTLLNGDTDKTVGQIYGLSSTTETEETAAIVEPTPATINAPKGSNAVYNFSIADLKDKTGAAVDTNTKLTDIVDDDGNAMFEEGDVIKFSWEEDGTANQKSYEVTSATTFGTLASALTSDVENFAYVAGFDGSSGAVDVTFSSTATDKVTDSGGQDLTTTENGIFIVGKEEVAITNLAVAVTYDNDGVTTTRTAAQEALAFTGVQQATAPTTGSHTVFGITDINGGSAITPITEDTLLTSVTDSNNNTLGTNNKSFSVSFGDTELVNIASVSNNATTGTKLSDVVTAFNTAATTNNLDIRMVVVEGGEELKDADGNNVTQNTLDGAQNIKAPTNGGIYFVNKAGEDVSDKITITSGATTIGGDTTYEVGKIQKAAESSEEETTGTSTAASTDLTFHVGGEAGFNLDISISKMTTESLFGVKSEEFAKMFLSKDALTKGDGTNGVVAMIDNAIQNALNEQTKLGAIESRLGYTSDNITTMNENLEAADSAYRDSDIAKEMTKYMKYSVLAQASQYMLAQTSQNAFSVLNLLQA